MEKTVIDSFKGKYAFLDNDFPCFIYHDGMRFSSCNRAYHASKSFDVRHRIGCMLAPDSKAVRTLGRKVELREDWDKIKLKLIYEDDISGAISHERFLKLFAEYEAEQKELTEKVKADREMVNAYEQDKADFDSFAAVIRKYVGVTELTPTIVNEFVKKIIVHAPDKSRGHRRQKIQIIWNFVGELKQDEDKQTIERQRKSRTA